MPEQLRENNQREEEIIKRIEEESQKPVEKLAIWLRKLERDNNPIPALKGGALGNSNMT